MGLKLNKKAQPSNPSANKLELYYDQTGQGTPGARALQAVDEAGNVAVLAHFNTLDYRLINVRILTSGTSYVPTEGTRAMYVECLGGGGGGGGATNAATNAAGGGGGGGGAYASKILTGAAVKNPTTYAVGAAGTGASGANGNPGGDTTWDTSVIVAKGGSGGIQQTVAAGPVMGGAGGAGGASASCTGDLKIDGSPGDYGIMLAAAQCAGGKGGAPGGGLGGGPGAAKISATATGNAATNFGGGGGGAAIVSGGATQTGGAGGAGVIRVWEFA